MKTKKKRNYKSDSSESSGFYQREKREAFKKIRTTKNNQQKSQTLQEILQSIHEPDTTKPHVEQQWEKEFRLAAEAREKKQKKNKLQSSEEEACAEDLPAEATEQNEEIELQSSEEEECAEDLPCYENNHKITEAEVNLEMKRCDMLKEGPDENIEKPCINKTLFKTICDQYTDFYTNERGIHMSQEAIDMLHELAENHCAHHFQIWNFLAFHGKRKVINACDVVLLKILNEINFTK